MCADIGLPMAQEKTSPPATSMSFVGYEIDSIMKEVRLPIDKVNKCIQDLEHMMGKKRATLRELQSITGTLNFASAVVIPGRPFLSRLNFLTRGLRAPVIILI